MSLRETPLHLLLMLAIVGGGRVDCRDNVTTQAVVILKTNGTPALRGK